MVLLVTLIFLVVMATISYTVTIKVTEQKHRQQYLIDYQAAVYGCDSAVKYAIATLSNISAEFISRPNEPDFSDLFAMTEQQYQQLIEEYALQMSMDESEDTNQPSGGLSDLLKMTSTALMPLSDSNDMNSASITASAFELNQTAQVEIPGPYGPQWPLVSKPAQIDIGSAQVTIQIEDENAKYPIVWALQNDPEIQREVKAGIQIFFSEWMDMDYSQVQDLQQQLDDISAIKPYNIKITAEKVPGASASSAKKPTSAYRSRVRRRSSRTVKKAAQRTPTQTDHVSDFAKLLHSSIIDAEMLTRPTIESDTREEYPMKYIGMWGSQRVNINSAPRHVLEAAFAYGGNEVPIAQQIIEIRKIKPIASIDQLKKDLLEYSTSIDKASNYITTASTFFTIKITAVSGIAKAHAIIAVKKTEKDIQAIAVITG